MLAKLLERLRLVSRPKITVIIPVLNEEKSIGNVIRLVRRSAAVDEVIVVDDNSADNTYAEALKNGATVFKSMVLGKGYSMREGLDRAKNDIVIFVDGDIDNYETDIVKKLSEPILLDKCDFVKATFSREAGRVTELVAKPLLSLLFPELTRFSQPLSGMIAAKREYLKRVSFENDYGVDIGILIDMHNQGARIREVDIGKIDNKSKPWQALGKMSREVSKAILKRAEIKKILNLDALESIHIIQGEMEDSLQDSMKNLKKMIIFDMDNTILQGRFIYKAVQELNLQAQFNDILLKNNEPYIVTKLIAALLKDVKLEEIFGIVNNIKIVADLPDVVAALKARGYMVCIVSDSYDIVTDYIKGKIGADINLSNELEVKNNRITGEVRIPSYFIRNERSLCSHTVCKSNALLYLAEKYGVSLTDMIAVGDSANDICMIKQAGIGVAFCSDNNLLNAIADRIITKRSFAELLSFAY